MLFRSGNCDTQIFLGGQEKTTLKDLEEALGDETIDLFNESRTFSANDSSGINYNKVGRKMKNLYELKTMDRNKCIVQISGLPPFLSNKYTPSMHPNFKYIMDADDKNEFDFKKYKEKLKKDNNVAYCKFSKDDVFLMIDFTDIAG